ncbi:fumarylacetoacetate hydrolase family protein [Parenemella sanctibonifatiensis]|uniref:2-hydroxyhepta-2,4-diene-1,7-dioate isomerase n=1 Tax=Parenemella sanctibonifatiensis TaxID=2016505 RepID=A0A255EER8_9ACTN|nr:fumarylacetoacetate hydrolase family protein [Parenemella sanctibonifatiensis]OYN90039.1 2-hydroxyhepta-2,4-diene-1,7-dioate isomerase [Parenemella sanctibonifatiensis]
MRIARVASGDQPRYAVIELAEDNGDHPETASFLNGDPAAGQVQYTGERVPLTEVRLLAPVIPRSKVLGVGRNYAAHATEMGNEVPAEPLVFFKPNTSVIGPGEAVVRPAGSTELSFEGELAVVIGRVCKQVPAERVPEVILGYTIANDITARDWQASDSQWSRAKGADTFCPLGPYLITHLSVEEASNLDITTTVNGQVRQQGNTRDMVRSIVDQIVWISQWTTLLPGDVILTGTPAGVGPIGPGDECSITVTDLGTLTNPFVGDSPVDV